MNPRAFGRYVLVETIGQGSSGIVWRARGEEGPDVAFKHPRFERFDVAQLSRARAELGEVVQRWGSLRQEAIAPVLELVDGPNGTFGLVSPLIDGQDLVHVLAGVDLSVPGRLESLLRVFEQLCSILADLHSAGLAHGNIVPGNVLLGQGRDRGRLFLLDLCWSRAGLTPPQVESHAPELLCGEAPRPASDQWSVAVMAQGVLERSGDPRWRVSNPLVRALERARSDALAERFPRIDQLGAALASARTDLSGPEDGQKDERTPSTPDGEPAPTTELSRERFSDEPPSITLEPLDAASLAPTVETERPRVSQGSLLTTELELDVDLAEEARPPTLAVAAIGPMDPTRPTQAVTSSANRTLALGLGAAGALALMIALSLMVRFERPPKPPASVAVQTATRSSENEGVTPSSVKTVSVETAPSAPAPALEETASEASSPPSNESEVPGRPQRALPRCRGAQPKVCRAQAEAALRSGRGHQARRFFERACDARDAFSCARLAELWKTGVGGETRERTAEGFRRRLARWDIPQAVDPGGARLTAQRPTNRPRRRAFSSVGRAGDF